MPHVTERDIVLGVLDRRIREAEKVAQKAWQANHWVNYGAWKFAARVLEQTRREVAEALACR